MLTNGFVHKQVHSGTAKTVILLLSNGHIIGCDPISPVYYVLTVLDSGVRFNSRKLNLNLKLHRQSLKMELLPSVTGSYGHSCCTASRWWCRPLAGRDSWPPCAWPTCPTWRRWVCTGRIWNLCDWSFGVWWDLSSKWFHRGKIHNSTRFCGLLSCVLSGHPFCEYKTRRSCSHILCFLLH